LLFGPDDRVVIVDGVARFTELPALGDGVRVWFAGSTWGGSPSVAALRSDPAGLFGRFVALIHEPAEARLTVVNDRHGGRRFFFSQASNRFVGSLSLSAMIERGVGDVVDSDALADVLAFNVPFGDRTLMRDVRVLTGAMRLVIDLRTGAMRLERTWQPDRLLAEAREPLAGVQRRLTELLLEGVDKATAGAQRVGVTLSGGVDSRLLLAAGLNLGRPMHAYATGVPGSRSLRYSQGMAKLCGIPYVPHPLGPEFVARFPALVADNVRLLDGMSFSSEAEAHWLSHHVPVDGTVMIHGAFAELYKIAHMHGYPWDRASRKAGREGLAESAWRRVSARFERRASLFEPVRRDAMRTAVRRNLAAKLAAYPQDIGLPGVLQNLYFDEFLGKVTMGSSAMWNAHVPTALPFSYPPYVDLLLRVRPRDKADLRFPLYFLKQVHKGLARFPDSNTGARIGSSATRIRLVHLRDWMRKKLFGSQLLFDHMDLATWIGGLSPALDERVRAQMPADVLDETGLVALRNGLIGGPQRAQSADGLLMLWMLALWASGPSRRPRF